MQIQIVYFCNEHVESSKQPRFGVGTKIKSIKKLNQRDSSITKAGRHSVACFLRTEKPPWVLVSEAVKTLQKE